MFNLKTKTLKIIILKTTMVLVLAATVSPINALDWNDKNWEASGCPENILGSWVSRDNGDSLEIDTNRLIFQAVDKNQHFYSYKHIDRDNNKKYVELILRHKNQIEERPLYLKIRPHLTNSSASIRSSQQKAENCFIKVFQFDNQKDAKLDKYMSWNIYKRK